MRALRILTRSIRDSFKSVFRNFSLSMASIACTTITLILVAISLVLTYNVRQVTTDLEHELTIVVYLNKDVTEEQKVRISNDLETMENVDSYVLKSKDEWKAEMKEEDGIAYAILTHGGRINKMSFARMGLPRKDTKSWIGNQYQLFDRTQNLALMPKSESATIEIARPKLKIIEDRLGEKIK